MKQHFDKGIWAVLGLLLAVIAGNAVVAYRSVLDFHDARSRADVSLRIQNSLGHVAEAAQLAEAGVRGYVITGEPRYLEPYESARASADRLLARVSDLTRDDPLQHASLAGLRQALRLHLAELAYIVGVRDRHGEPAARAAMLADRGQAAMEALRRAAGRLESAAALSLHGAMRDAAHGKNVALGALAFSGALGALMIVVLTVQMRRTFRARDAAAAVLGEQRELFHTTLSSLGEAVVTCNPAGRITFINAAAETLTHWSAAKAVGVPIDDVVRVVDARTHQPLESCAARALRAGAPVPSEHRGTLVARGGDERPVDDSAFPIRDAQGRLAGAVLVFRDITERKRSEDALREADRRKDEFLAVLAHELRNPLAPLRNALQVLRLAGSDRATVEQVSALMDRQVRQMVRLIDDLLDVSRITRDKLELRKERVDVKEVIDAALEMSAPTVSRYRQRVELTLGPRCPALECDRARLVQTLDNLITNAAKYSDPGGLISIAAEASGDKLRIRVKDAGIGIPRHMLERVFDMFTQVDRSLERSRSGLGIGLTLVRRIVELHGGTVTATSAGAGKGSEFVVLLPAATAALRPAAAPAPELDAAARPRRVLVADDNEDSAESMMRTLRAVGHEVRTAFDGEQCVAEGRAFLPEVVLLDIGMPRLNGYDAARRIRTEPWGRGVLLIAMTGWGQEEDRRRARDAGFDHHLVKPVDFAHLERLLHAGNSMDERQPEHADS
jgi:PAS domain S-box-containing protein